MVLDRLIGQRSEESISKNIAGVIHTDEDISGKTIELLEKVFGSGRTEEDRFASGGNGATRRNTLTANQKRFKKIAE
jgi:hypothetical protein